MKQTDEVYEDIGGPGEHDGNPWTFAPEDSGIAWRFPTEQDAQAFALKWISERNNSGPAKVYE